MRASDPTPRPAPPSSWRGRFARAGWWLAAGLALFAALAAARMLWGKLRAEAWAYYTDGGELRAEVNDPRARPVLWQDPEPHHFDDPDGGGANAPARRLEAAFSPDGTAMLLVRADPERGDSDIYQSRWDGRIWSRPVPLKAVNTAANERGPAFSQDGRWLYFASDREGGQGGYDIYVCRRQGDGWAAPKALPEEVNSPHDELGPAPAPDGSRLLFSSDRGGAGGEDIFASRMLPPTRAESGRAIPRFGRAEPVEPLNSAAADVKAAMTARGDHVFLASDRGRDGFRVYLSRVVGGETLPPEEIDLDLGGADATDPAVRMEGFDLVISSNRDGAGDESSFRLFRSTTREVIAFTDLSRWQQFKELMRQIAWWILLAIAALLALIYILERWRDITSLYHKCLAGSALLHLIALLLTMLWLVAQEISRDELSRSEEIEIPIDALAQEELALESMPEEVELTETTTALESEKIESDFGAPGFEAPEEVQPVAEARTAREAVVEARPEMSEARDQPVPEPMRVAGVLSELSAAALPEVELAEMEERAAAGPPAANEAAEFQPDTPAHQSAKAEAEPLADDAVTAPSEFVAAEPVETTTRESAVAAAEAAVEAPAETANPSDLPPLEAESLTDLPEMTFEDSGVALEEAAAVDESAPADTAQDTFAPGDAVADLATTPATDGPASGTAVAAAPAASAVPAAGSAAAAAADAIVVTAAESGAPADDALPAVTAEPAPPGLPALTLALPDAPQLDEGDPAGAASPAEVAANEFRPAEIADSPASTPAEARPVEDTALSSAAGPAEFEEAEIAAAVGIVAGSAPAEGDAGEPAIPGSSATIAAADLPEMRLLEPAEVAMLEEPVDRGATPADTTRDQFQPAAAAGLATVPAEVTPARTAGTPDAMPAEMVQPSAPVRGAAEIGAQPGAVADGPADAPPATAPLDREALPDVSLAVTMDVVLEEPAPGGAAPRNADGEAFEPAAAAGLVTSPAAAAPATGGTAAAAAGQPAMAMASTRDGAAGEPISTRPVEAGPAGLPPTATVATGIGELGTVSDGLLPDALEAPAEGTKAPDLATVIRKQRGKPDLDTIKEMGGSDGTEKAISAAIEWLVRNQEADGCWDTRKHGAKLNHDPGGTGLALLCFYGWGARHDAGEYQDPVRKALDWLLAQQDADGYLGGDPGRMYSHAIGAIVLCEAFGITGDQHLRKPAEQAIAYTLAAQSKTLGGWRYSPGNNSDTSVTGWQYMALHSARMAGLDVPDEAFERARGFLDRMAGGRDGGLYGYQQRGNVSRAMVATGMFCRQLDLVPPSHPMMQESARFLKLHPMESARPDLYYVYYATLALYQHQGPVWTAWNERLKELLPLLQDKTGPNAGSWEPSSSMTAEGGRVVSTTLATLSLEVYYRLLPMYGFRNTEAEAPEVKTRSR